LIYKTRKAFTLIEFIFVIIIIAILAAIAIPKLAAVRMDAKLSTKANNIMVAATEIASYAVARGSTTSDLRIMSHSIRSMVNRSEATLSAYQANIKVDDSDDCIIIKIDDPGSSTEVLKIDYGNTTNPYCDQLRSLIDINAFPMKLHGTSIIY
jgi:prepilin-type N-terminal cleavage/methylation domain-containing protein